MKEERTEERVIGAGESEQFFVKTVEGQKLKGVWVEGDAVLHLLIVGGKTFDMQATPDPFEDGRTLDVPAGSFLIATLGNPTDSILTSAVTFEFDEGASEPTRETGAVSVPQDPGLTPKQDVRAAVTVPARPAPDPVNPPPAPPTPKVHDLNHVTICCQRAEAVRLLEVVRGGYAIQAYERSSLENALQRALGEVR